MLSEYLGKRKVESIGNIQPLGHGGSSQPESGKYILIQKHSGKAQTSAIFLVHMEKRKDFFTFPLLSKDFQPSHV